MEMKGLRAVEKIALSRSSRIKLAVYPLELNDRKTLQVKQSHRKDQRMVNWKKFRGP
jgi:hypothetical protein